MRVRKEKKGIFDEVDGIKDGEKDYDDEKKWIG